MADGSRPASWAPFDLFVLRATGMPLAWIVGPDAAPVWTRDEASYADALVAARRLLASFVDRPLVREALFMSNPTVDANLARYRESLLTAKRVRKHRRREAAKSRYMYKLTPDQPQSGRYVMPPANLWAISRMMDFTLGFQ